MRLLSDTHALIWFLSGSSKLSRAARDAFEVSTNDIVVSAASAWEITTKYRLGKLPDVGAIVDDVRGECLRRGFSVIPIEMREAELAGRLEGNHRDPFDRMLIAQALTNDLTLVSNERAFDAFGVSRLW